MRNERPPARDDRWRGVTPPDSAARPRLVYLFFFFFLLFSSPDARHLLVVGTGATCALHWAAAHCATAPADRAGVSDGGTNQLARRYPYRRRGSPCRACGRSRRRLAKALADADIGRAATTRTRSGRARQLVRDGTHVRPGRGVNAQMRPAGKATRSRCARRDSSTRSPVRCRKRATSAADARAYITARPACAQNWPISLNPGIRERRAVRRRS